MTLRDCLEIFDGGCDWPSSSDLLTLLFVAYRADRKGIVREPQTDMAADTGLSRRTVARTFAWLEDNDVLERMGHGRFRLNRDNLRAMIDEWGAPTVPRRKGYIEETERLKAIRLPHQGIVYQKDGWPVLQDRVQYGSDDSDDDD